MEHLTYEQLLLLVEKATEKSFFDYITLVVSSAVTLLAVGMSYFFFKNHSNQVTNEKVIEKEVEKLYEAVDCLFEFCNAVDLYLSMKEKSLSRLQKGEVIDGSFKTKVDEATDGVFARFKYAHKASFILRALGEREVSSKIDVYRSDAIQLRKEIYLIELNISNTDGIEQLENFLVTYASRVSVLSKQKDQCLDAVAQCKKRIKSVL
ncbi:TPA: hypothetical protein GRI37_22855 [Vibrio parahaemolyticus]|nr:hypothetical protein [Vibrio parahaemolyticus]HAS6755910.1 hypothetical protein [Vibrio parahaemolyticus]HAS6775456.1 hypothetical protein [Vibrio parahaemolyticus]HAS6863428.1 hypothetical protein [Vibrio parahaemolyticus]HAS6877378.1 hypothetical protein [Vibrio parahaemolyticus]